MDFGFLAPTDDKYITSFKKKSIGTSARDYLSQSTTTHNS